MPAVTHKRRTGLKPKTPRKAPPTFSDPEPGIGGYDYPRGPFGATGFPGSTPASARVKPQGPDGRKDPAYRGNPHRVADEQGREWNELPGRVSRADSYMGGRPLLVREDATEQQPKSPYRPVPSIEPAVTGRQRQPTARRKRLTTGPERREIPTIGGAPGSQNVRNEVAQRYKARPELVREYRASPNPGKTGAQFDGPSRYHPGTTVHGHPDGKPVPGMAPQPGYPPTVTVQSRFSVTEGGSQEGYAMNRPLLLAKGGTPAPYPAGYEGNVHLRGGRLTGQRYFGDLADQQRIGLPSDSFGISRARGPRHRPVRFEQPPPHAANYYDLPPAAGEPPDMIHRSPGRGRPHASRPRRG